MISTYASGITTGTIGTEFFLSSPNAQGKFVLYVDLSNMASGDYTEIKRWKMVVAGGTPRMIDSQTYQGAQPSGMMIAESQEIWNSLTDTNAVRFSLIQSLGTARAYSWSVLLDDALAPIVSGRTLDVDTNGDVGITTGTFIDAMADAVWNDIITQHLQGGSTGERLYSIATGSAGASDPWTTVLPGSYTGAQAGNLLASRMPTGTVIVGQNNDKTGYSLSTPQSFNLIGNISGTLSNVNTVVNPVVASSVTGNVGGSVGSVTQPVGISTGSFIDAIADQVWNETLAGHLQAGSTGERLNATSTGTISVTDPWTVALPGSYTGSQAGNILASRMPTGTVIVGQNNDKTGYSLSSPQIINISGTITNVLNVSNPVTVGTNTDKTGYSLSSPQSVNIIGNISGTLSTVLNVTNPVGITTGSFIDAVADQVWNEQIAGHLQAGSTGEKLNAAGSAGDPWTTSLPGAYVAGQAGYILASRMPTGTVIVGQNNDKTGYSLSSPQFVNISGTITNVVNVINPTVATVSGTVVVGTNNDKTGYSLLTTEHTNIADALLKRDWTAVTGEASRSVLNALRKLRNKVSFNGTNTLSIKKEDDSTNAYTQSVVEDANQDPFKEVG